MSCLVNFSSSIMTISWHESELKPVLIATGVNHNSCSIYRSPPSTVGVKAFPSLKMFRWEFSCLLKMRWCTITLQFQEGIVFGALWDDAFPCFEVSERFAGSQCESLIAGFGQIKAISGGVHRDTQFSPVLNPETSILEFKAQAILITSRVNDK